MPKDCADRDGAAGQAAERDSLWVRAYPRAGIFRGVYSDAPSAATGCIAAFAPLSSARSRRCSWPSFTGPLGFWNSHSLDGNTTRQPGRHTRGTSSPAGTVVGDPGTRPGRGRSTRVSPETVQPAHNLLAELWQGNPAGSERESPVGPLKVASLRAVARRER